MEFLDKFLSKIPISNFTKIRQVGAAMRTDITKLIGAFRCLCERAYNGVHSYGSELQSIRQQMKVSMST